MTFDEAVSIVRPHAEKHTLLAALRPLAALPVGPELLITDDCLDTVLYKNGGAAITARDVMIARAAIAAAELTP